MQFEHLPTETVTPASVKPRITSPAFFNSGANVTILIFSKLPYTCLTVFIPYESQNLFGIFTKLCRLLPTFSNSFMLSIRWAPFLSLLMNGPSVWTPKIVAPFLLPGLFLIRGNTVWYTFALDVTSVGQKEVTPWARSCFPTKSTPCSTFCVLYEKSKP